MRRKKINFRNSITKSLCLLVAGIAFLGCAKEEPLSNHSVVELGVLKREQTELDKWILETFTQPYGIEIEYRWDKNVSQSGTYTYPPEVEKIKPVLETIKTLWIDLYTAPDIGGKDFLKGKNPIKIYLYGGSNVDANGTLLLGNAEAAANEMFIYNVNSFDAKDENKVYLLMRSVHHQFAKRLMEVFPYNRDRFQDISKNFYLGSTQAISWFFKGQNPDRRLFTLVRYANTKGFLTYHSLISAEQDFAEIISAKLTHSHKDIAKALLEAKTPEKDYSPDPEIQKGYDEDAKKAYESLTQKLKFVEDYFDKEVKISLSYLQQTSIRQLKAYTKQK